MSTHNPIGERECMKRTNVTRKDILKAVYERRLETDGAIGPTLREMEEMLVLSFSSIQWRVILAIELGYLSCVWVPYGTKKRVAPHSLDITEKGLALLKNGN